MRRRYTEEFKESAARMVIEGKVSAREASANLGVKLSTLLSWVRRRRDGEAAVQDDLRRQVRKMQAEIDRLKAERDILKKAAAYFAREDP